MTKPFTYQNIKFLEQHSLPGYAAHHMVMSYPRQTVDEAKLLDPKPRKSGVLLLLFPRDNDWHIVLTKRNVYHGTHSGQISLPGGKMEPNDRNETHTALRETEEEVGIRENQIEIIRDLSPLYIPPSNFIVQPALGISSERITFTPDPREVDRVIEMPLTYLLKENSLEETKVLLSGTNQKIKVKAYVFENEIIWGATAMILTEFREMLRNL